ncbi:endolytic transglycosylase MltG [Hydrogenophaga atypica]|uniref:Endolytic murein transglycosylase n=1 Tax=Hydrogenophaga atypica TaxID=249409 RepID=A0ABW2QLM7_9BURK
MKRLLLAGLLGAVLAAAAGAWWWQRPLPLRPLAGQTVVDVTVPAGASARGVAEALVAAGVDTPAWLLHLGFRASGESRRIKAGSYELEAGATPQSVLDKLVRGDQALRQVTLVEGWTFRQVLAALRAAEHLEDDIGRKSPSELMVQLGYAGRHPEGRFFPDTYRYAKRSPASVVLRQAAQAMQQQLDAAWAQRQPGLPLKNADEALILASIVEKETGQAADRGQVAAVFINRLRIGMRLQTDPTVIYGLGERFDGNLRKRDLQADTPYNSYTRSGLPPTPIAMPGKAALLAAVQPAASQALYFVARGDGSSQFSATLDDHNRAVRQYQLKR